MKSPIPFQIIMPSTIRGTSKMDGNNPNTAPSPILSLKRSTSWRKMAPWWSQCLHSRGYPTLSASCLPQFTPKVAVQSGINKSLGSNLVLPMVHHCLIQITRIDTHHRGHRVSNRFLNLQIEVAGKRRTWTDREACRPSTTPPSSRTRTAAPALTLKLLQKNSRMIESSILKIGKIMGGS